MKKFKKLLAIIMTVACFCSVFSMSAGAAVTTSKDYAWTYSQTGNHVGDVGEFTLSYPSKHELEWTITNASMLSLELNNKKNSSDGYVTGTIPFHSAGTCKFIIVDDTTGEKVVSKDFTIEPYVESLSFNKGTKTSFSVGDTAVLRYSAINYEGKKIKADSFPEAVEFKVATSDKNVVKVKSAASGKIKIKAVGAGTATIKVKAMDGSGVSQTIKVTVK